MRAITPDESKSTIYHGQGCATCNNTGYKGRVGLYEVMEINDELARIDSGGRVRHGTEEEGSGTRNDHLAPQRLDQSGRRA